MSEGWKKVSFQAFVVLIVLREEYLSISLLTQNVDHKDVHVTWI